MDKKEENDMATTEKALKEAQQKRRDIIRSIAKEACDRNDEALRRLSKN